MDWDWLLVKRPTGTSFLKKWSESLKRVAKLGPIRSASLRTNRSPNEEFEKALNGHHVDLSRVGGKRRRAIEAELGGSGPAAEFFAQFRFSHSEAFIDQLENQLKGSIVPADTDNLGWLWLRSQARRWATRKLEPEPDGKIRHQHLVQTITKKRAQPIPQDFQIPAVYCRPSDHFHTAFISRISSAATPISILWGTPGRGKSTYLSFVIEDLRQRKIPAIRHHYFLSLDDTTSVSLFLLGHRHILDGPDGCSLSRRCERIGRVQRSTPKMDRGMRTQLCQGGEAFCCRCGWTRSCLAGTHKHFPDGAFIQLFAALSSQRDIGCWHTEKFRSISFPGALYRMRVKAIGLKFRPWTRVQCDARLAGQYEAGRVRLPNNSPPAAFKNEELRAIGSAFFKISQGHPLHLIYSFEALVKRGTIFTPEEILLLPTCPEGDIRKYYSVRMGAAVPQRETDHPSYSRFRFSLAPFRY